MKRQTVLYAIFLFLLFSFLNPARAFATLDQAKLYQATFGGEKPKCLTCHMDKLPKKEDGKHDPNAYGKKLISENPKPEEATYKKVGANQDAVYS